jgi:DMSO/TMAO reductase YedYZ heme-binding membrane subunit
MFVIVAKYLIPNGYRGLTLFPFVFIKYAFDRENKVLVNHEKIHLRQQLELLVLPFFVWYFIEYAVRLLQYKNANLAYRNISFEREAYANELDLDYLKTRTFFRFLSCLRKDKK